MQKYPVIPAKAGIRKLNAAAICRKRLKLKELDSHLRGNDGGGGLVVWIGFGGLKPTLQPALHI
ncbi:hypothetical protein [Neisseria polysaccharea]|uniref:hypothetical protein n=1 Tax=Neisseria polysaccharea TaxID=489 RepID=UPI0001D9DEE4|nr:hypothetical protein [Neisseria polysaccharea]EFH24137.1 hypothetical protein NEIPOLOT_00072 [Neisseria polysaccharea ATCC 43768]